MDIGARNASQPLLTYYASDGGRTELSGATLANWQAKTANLLMTNYDVGPGSRVALCLPNHWVIPAIVGALAWLDAELILTANSSLADLDIATAIVGERQLDNLPDCDNVLACSIGASSNPIESRLPVGIDDFFAEVRMQPDAFVGRRSGRTFPLVSINGSPRDYADGDMLNDFILTNEVASAARVLVALDRQTALAAPMTMDALVATAALPAIRGMSVVVLTTNPDTDLEHIQQQERSDGLIVLSSN